MADSVKVQIVVNGKVVVDRELNAKHTVQYVVGKDGDGRLGHSCTLIELQGDTVEYLPLIRPTMID